MNSGLEVELLALVEKLKPDQLPKAAAVLLKAWCDHRDVSLDSAYEFFVEILEADECCQRNAATRFPKQFALFCHDRPAE